MSDPLLDRFSDLVPGKKPPVNRTAEAVQSLLAQESWDEHPVKYFYNGVEHEFFTIGSLAAALGKSVVTIRSWENKGKIPKSPYTSPPPRRETIPGRVPKGKRLWTRAQIEGIIHIAKQEKVILNGKPPTDAFAQKVRVLFQQLLQQEQEQTHAS